MTKRTARLTSWMRKSVWLEGNEWRKEWGRQSWVCRGQMMQHFVGCEVRKFGFYSKCDGNILESHRGKRNRLMTSEQQSIIWPSPSLFLIRASITLFPIYWFHGLSSNMECESFGPSYCPSAYPLCPEHCLTYDNFLVISSFLKVWVGRTCWLIVWGEDTRRKSPT